MGMFDYVKCEFPLPIEGMNDRLYQTKSFDNSQMRQFRIASDGILWVELEETEGERVYRYTGSINFYDIIGGWDSNGWIEWSVRFESGHAKEMALVKHVKPY